MAPANRPTEGRSRLRLLIALAVVIAVILLWEHWPDGSSEAARSPAAAPQEARAAASGLDQEADLDDAGEGAAHPLANLKLDDLNDTVRRPLFEKQRRPVVAPPPRKAAPPSPKPVAAKRPVNTGALTLLGVLTSEGQAAGAIALMRRNHNGQNVRLQEGDTVDGWTIELIEAERVFIRQGDTKLALELFRRP
jgi:hypothetical protein